MAVDRDAARSLRWPLVRRSRFDAVNQQLATLQAKYVKSNTWNRNHQRRCERLKGQIRSDQVYIDALEEQLPQHVIERIREAVRPSREEAKARA